MFSTQQFINTIHAQKRSSSLAACTHSFSFDITISTRLCPLMKTITIRHDDYRSTSEKHICWWKKESELKWMRWWLEFGSRCFIFFEFGVWVYIEFEFWLFGWSFNRDYARFWNFIEFENEYGQRGWIFDMGFGIWMVGWCQLKIIFNLIRNIEQCDAHNHKRCDTNSK